MPAYKDEKTKKWYCKFYYIDWNGKSQQKKKSGFDKKREALEWERDFLQNHATNPDAKLSSICDKYLELKKLTWKDLTYQSASNVIKNHIKPFLGDMPINEITPLMISEWQKQELENVSKESLKLYKGILTSIFNFAKANYKLSSNPCSMSEKIKVPKKEMNFLTIEEFKKIINVEMHDQLVLAIKVLFWTGMRWGELTALTVQDIHYDYIRINKNHIYVSGEGHKIQNSTKSENGIRKVPIHKKLSEDIQTYLGSLYGISNDTIIFDISRDGFRRQLRRACQSSGVKTIRTHDLRHSHVALLIHMGLFPNAIAKRIGDTPDTVINTYAHIYEEDEKALAAQLDEMDI